MSEIRFALKSWWEDCWKRWTQTALGLTAILGLLFALNGIVPLRFWAWASEVRTLATRIYPITIAEHRAVMGRIEARIKWLEAELASKGSLDPVQWQELWGFRNDLAKAQEQETELLRERAQFQLNLKENR